MCTLLRPALYKSVHIHSRSTNVISPISSLRISAMNMVCEKRAPMSDIPSAYDRALRKHARGINVDRSDDCVLIRRLLPYER